MPVCANQKYRLYIRNRHYSAYCHHLLFPSLPGDFTGTTWGNWHYSNGTIEGPLLRAILLNRHYRGTFTTSEKNAQYHLTRYIRGCTSDIVEKRPTYNGSEGVKAAASLSGVDNQITKKNAPLSLITPVITLYTLSRKKNCRKKKTLTVSQTTALTLVRLLDKCSFMGMIISQHNKQVDSRWAGRRAGFHVPAR